MTTLVAATGNAFVSVVLFDEEISTTGALLADARLVVLALVLVVVLLLLLLLLLLLNDGGCLACSTMMRSTAARAKGRARLPFLPRWLLLPLETGDRRRWSTRKVDTQAATPSTGRSSC